MTLETAQKQFPVESRVSFVPSRGARMTARVVGHRQNGGSVFVETEDTAGRKRSIRPGSCTAA